ncbi:NAD(P)H-hydrate dehydratase [endosymbiont of Lamellibrachia barhami]|uniref:NAD(P)H-hydrate dehydratase n=1 Tax=endosymbiont of Lamellibrachia barhami TaxID=205975 RepID=UPI0034E1D3DE
MRVMPYTESLPYALYRADQVRAFDRIAIEEYEIPGADLMERAGSRIFQLLQASWPAARHITVVCGSGNNGGDGFVVARLARQAGLEVLLLQLGDSARIRGDALTMAQKWEEVGGETAPFPGLPRKTDLIIDALLGTGLERDVTGAWAETIESINHHQAPVLAVDIPSGLNSDTGQVMGIAVRADATLSFIGLKQGMFTGAGPDYCGRIHFDALELPARIYGRQILSARRIDWKKQSQLLAPRRRTAHKGDFGHLLLIGGDRGFSGAIRLAAEAAARTGAGLVSVATHPDNAPLLNIGRPELMCHAVTKGVSLAPLIERADAIALGPGLGRGEWGRSLYQQALASGLPLVVDADALNLLAQEPIKRSDWILTPHPGEAGRLLGEKTSQIQANRFEALKSLQERFGGAQVLKGAGTLITDGSSRPPALCSDGNPGMATGGSGDILTGIIAALLVQGFAPGLAAELGVSLHAAAGDRAAVQGERGMLAGDLLSELRPLLNLECDSYEA